MSSEKTSPLLIGLAVVALLLGAAGLYVGLGAKSDTKSDKELTSSIDTEVSKQLAAQAVKDKEQATAAALNAKRTSATKADIAALNKKIAALTKKLATQTTGQAQLKKDLEALTQRVTKLENSKK